MIPEEMDDVKILQFIKDVLKKISSTVSSLKQIEVVGHHAVNEKLNYLMMLKFINKALELFPVTNKLEKTLDKQIELYN